LFSKIRAAAIAAIFAIGALGTTTQPAYAAVDANNGLCAGNQWAANLTGQWYYQNTGTQNFDDVQGYLTDRALYPCEGLYYQGWSFAAAANVQGASGTCVSSNGNCVWQLGMYQDGGNAGDQNYFVYTDYSGSGVPIKITTVRPSFGNRYKFRIFKNSTGQIGYWIGTSTGTQLWAHGTSTWPSDTHTAWWGYETGNSRTLAGLDPNDSAADLVGLWSIVGSSTLNTQTYITSICSSPSGGPTCAERATRSVTGGSNEIFNVYGLTTG
jgi:hypothetical protein